MISEEREKLELKEYKRQLREKAADEREAKTGIRQSKGAMAAKIIIGCLFISVSFSNPEGGWSFSYFLVSCVLGGSFIAWGLIPYYKAKEQREKEETERILREPLHTYAELELQQAMERTDRENEDPEIKELRKYKELMEQGLINEKDYEKKKKKLLKL